MPISQVSKNEIAVSGFAAPSETLYFGIEKTLNAFVIGLEIPLALGTFYYDFRPGNSL